MEPDEETPVSLTRKQLNALKRLIVTGKFHIYDTDIEAILDKINARLPGDIIDV